MPGGFLGVVMSSGVGLGLLMVVVLGFIVGGEDGYIVSDFGVLVTMFIMMCVL